MSQISTPVDLAIAMAGSTKKLADRLGVTRQCVTHWKRSGVIPIAKVPEVARITGIPKARLHPAFTPEASTQTP